MSTIQGLLAHTHRRTQEAINRLAVRLVVRGERVERRAVKVGAADGEQTEIVSGLNAGDRVVSEGPATLADGARVKER